MDRERFGRALGQGARDAARAMLKAADAAASPDPKATRAAGQAAGERVRQSAPQAVAAARRGVVEGRRGAAEAKTTSRGVKEGGRRFGEAVWGPFARASGQLWLELTGVFFGLFALSAAIYAVRLHGAFRLGGEQARNAWFAVVMLAVFGYFAVSSFVRANRKGKRR